MSLRLSRKDVWGLASVGAEAGARRRSLVSLPSDSGYLTQPSFDQLVRHGFSFKSISNVSAGRVCAKQIYICEGQDAASLASGSVVKHCTNQSINYVSCPWDGPNGTHQGSHQSGGSTDNIFNNVGNILGPTGSWKMEKDTSKDMGPTEG